MSHVYSYTYIYKHIRMYTYICICIFIHIIWYHIHVYTYVYSYTLQTCTHVYVCLLHVLSYSINGHHWRTRSTTAAKHSGAHSINGLLQNIRGLTRSTADITTTHSITGAEHSGARRLPCTRCEADDVHLIHGFATIGRRQLAQKEAMFAVRPPARPADLHIMYV